MTMQNYTTTQMSLAGALYTKGFPLIGHDGQLPFTNFVFGRKQGERIEDVVDSFQRNDLLLPAKAYYQNVGYLRKLVREGQQRL